MSDKNETKSEENKTPESVAKEQIAEVIIGMLESKQDAKDLTAAINNLTDILASVFNVVLDSTRISAMRMIADTTTETKSLTKDEEGFETTTYLGKYAVPPLLEELLWNLVAGQNPQQPTVDESTKDDFK